MIYDLLIVGGGINGAGIAADATGRGLTTLLCEMNDLGSATSSNSSKLIHGGLRYLEHYEFRLVKEALAEREVLLKKAPHIMWPLRFRLPHRPYLRPAWMIRLGLFLYDHLSRRTTLTASHNITFSKDSPVVDSLSKGFEYSDCWVDDARLVALNAMAARQKGANILTRTKLIAAQRQGELWQATLENQLTGEKTTVTSRALVNAAGPWVTRLFDQALTLDTPKKIRLVKGSHIVVPRIHEDPEAYILQNEDNRIVFVIPYEDNFSLIGTTDVEYQGDPANVEISQEEINYLISVNNSHFKHKINPNDIIASYAGVRPLLEDDASSPDKVTRDYTFEIDKPDKGALLLSVFGGKITTYRKLSEAVVDHISPYFTHSKRCNTRDEPLPGGNFESQAQLISQLQKDFPWLPQDIIRRYTRSYGTLSYALLTDCHSLVDMGHCFGEGLYQKEVEYLIREEWAMTVEDIIWRRTKLGLFLSDENIQELTAFLDNYPE